MNINITELIKKDFWSICILMVAILLCMFALNSVKDVEQRCNDKWIKEFEEKCTIQQNLPEIDGPVFDDIIGSGIT